mmetsp:Transcript_12882/g.19966  ORF Transcript_12882/g.19966 Transcript_12882/m.19966 type:complete len:286 (+) Transcript_12882:259-1116(+)
MAPGGNGWLAPICCFDRTHQFGCVNKFFVCFNRNKVGMSPFLVQESQVTLVFLVKGHFPIISLTPCCHDEFSTWFQHSHHFIDVGFLVRHVLTTFACPNDIKRVIGEVHFESIHYHKLCVGESTLFSQFSTTLDLIRAQCDTCHIRLWTQLVSKVTTCSTEATSDIQHFRALVGLCIDTTERHHLINKVIFRLDEILLLVSILHFFFVIIAQMDVFSPVILKNTILCPSIVFLCYRIFVVGTGWTIKHDLHSGCTDKSSTSYGSSDWILNNFGYNLCLEPHRKCS